MKKSTRGHMRASDGHYHINGKKYSMLIVPEPKLIMQQLIKPVEV